ncbi:hypothetical protein HYFRA_00008692 [Hymenoscyphus fraxineus]|uniref:Uncharacterized protein n=1 Tax=Hymenoscyphus fraxineus TaxID=746836 RepID=A0A9N9KYP2_9HELO|nr:hypothetical protein HYFRA_00008692 [Hymenoscyphus fraxineus]
MAENSCSQGKQLDDLAKEIIRGSVDLVSYFNLIVVLRTAFSKELCELHLIRKGHSDIDSSQCSLAPCADGRNPILTLTQRPILISSILVSIVFQCRIFFPEDQKWFPSTSSTSGPNARHRSNHILELYLANPPP